MQDHGASSAVSGFQSALLFESPEEIYARVFRELKPRTPLPRIAVEFCRFANADSFIRFEAGAIHVRVSDLLEGAPAPVAEALAHILLGKMFRRPAARIYTHRYRLYLNRRDVRRQMHLVRQIRGRKFVSGPQGSHYNLEKVFEELNAAHFEGLLARPQLGWSREVSRNRLGHFDPSHNAIIISRIFDREEVPPLALAYVMFHEMLHLRFPVEHNGARRRVHTKGFQEAEKQFAGLKEAKELLKKL
ncbi:MAG: SprT-like domain-containing protein [Bryobacteraceae bacterium]